MEGTVVRLLDGVIVWFAGPKGAVMLEGSTWVPAKGVTVGDVTVAKRLTDSEIKDLVANGILPQ